MVSIRRFTLMVAVAAIALGAVAPTTLASGQTDQERAEAAGWGCAAAVGLPAGHCISPGTVQRWPDALIASGGTFQLRVFDGSGNFRTAEIASFKASSDGRACPNDPESPDGTYWEFVPGLWVCHHQPE
jgi:hypothetical protein